MSCNAFAIARFLVYYLLTSEQSTYKTQDENYSNHEKSASNSTADGVVFEQLNSAVLHLHDVFNSVFGNFFCIGDSFVFAFSCVFLC